MRRSSSTLIIRHLSKYSVDYCYTTSNKLEEKRLSDLLDNLFVDLFVDSLAAFDILSVQGRFDALLHPLHLA